MKVIRLMTCKTAFEANLIKGRLENEGIPSFLTGENFTTLMPNFLGSFGSGVQVMVFEKDKEKADEVLKTIED
jgi:hypothetical protein